MQAGTLLESPRPTGSGARPAEAQGLAASLAVLDRALEAAIADVERTFVRDPASAPFRGLYVSPADATRLLALVPGRTAWTPAPGAEGQCRFLRKGDASPLATLRRRFALDAFETDALLVAASPDLDQRYERLYGLLQDDVTRRRPTLATVAHLAAPEPLPQWQVLGRLFSGPSTLLRSGLARAVADPAQATLGAHQLVADPQVVQFLAGNETLAPALHAFCELRAPAPLAGFDATCSRHPGVAQALRAAAAGTVRFTGATAWERRHLAHAVASRRGLALLCVRFDSRRHGAQDLAKAQLAARLRDAILFVDAGAGDPLPDHDDRWLAAAGGVCILSTPHAEDVSGTPVYEVRLPSAGERLERWTGVLRAAGRHAARHDLEEVAREFQLDTEQTDDAATQACAAENSEATLSRMRLLAAARRPLALGLPSTLLAVELRTHWCHLALTDDTGSQLREICVHARERSRVLDDWGFGAASSRGQGMSVLFSGSSGTGKSTACEALAADLGRSLLKIDLSQAVSKYLGESEKQLAQVFDIAERSGAVLLFDEADALFGKRTAVSDAHDRYANIEVSYLLQRMDAFRGILVLTTNMQANMDAAFVRRLQFIVEFPFPDADQRERIWRISVPAQAPQDPDLDFAVLAQRYAVAGGSIRNIALSAAMLAAGGGQRIGMRHMAHAALREYRKLGKALPEADYFSSGAPR
jgi:hypothetical protein